jgi:antitoxin HigA-1
MLPKNRPPTPPGVMLLEEYLMPRRLTQVELAARMGVPIQRIDTIVNGRRGDGGPAVGGARRHP